MALSGKLDKAFNAFLLESLSEVAPAPFMVSEVLP